MPHICKIQSFMISMYINLLLRLRLLNLLDRILDDDIPIFLEDDMFINIIVWVVSKTHSLSKSV